MAGLLGDSWDDPRSAANMALAAGLLQGNMGMGFVGANQAYGNSRADALKAKLGQAQIDNFNSEIATRQASMQREQQLMDIIRKRMQGAATQSAPVQPGQLGSGSFGAVAPAPGVPAIPQAAAPSPNGGGFISSLTGDEAFLFKALGKDPIDVINAFKPKWENVGGNMVNTNDPNFRGGFVPQVKFDERGGATMLRPGANGMPEASIVPGSLEAYSQFRKADAGIAADNDLVKVVAPDGSERYLPKSQVIRAASPQPRQVAPAAPQGQPQGAYVGDPQVVMAAINDIKDPAERARAKQAWEQQYGPLQASPTTKQATAAAADKEQAVQTAKDVAEQRKSIMNAGLVAPSNIAKYQQIGKLLADVDGGKYTPAGTEFASALNGFGIKIDKNLPNKQAAMSLANEAALQLRSPSGGAGMPGAMSDQDRQFLASMTPNIAQSAQGRKMVIDSFVAVQQRNQQVAQFARNYEKKYGKLDNGFFDQLQAWSNANPLFKGQ